MPLFPTITVCTDHSPGALAAVERAAPLAQEHGAALCLLQVFTGAPGNMALHVLQFVPGDVLVMP